MIMKKREIRENKVDAAADLIFRLILLRFWSIQFWIFWIGFLLPLEIYRINGRWIRNIKKSQVFRGSLTCRCSCAHLDRARISSSRVRDAGLEKGSAQLTLSSHPPCATMYIRHPAVRDVMMDGRNGAEGEYTREAVRWLGMEYGRHLKFSRSSKSPLLVVRTAHFHNTHTWNECIRKKIKERGERCNITCCLLYTNITSGF
jgi:hypothetical protein